MAKNAIPYFEVLQAGDLVNQEQLQCGYSLFGWMRQNELNHRYCLAYVIQVLQNYSGFWSIIYEGICEVGSKHCNKERAIILR